MRSLFSQKYWIHIQYNLPLDSLSLSYVLTNKADLNIESHGPIETPCPITIEEFLVDNQTNYHVGACANAKDFVISVSSPVITFPI